MCWNNRRQNFRKMGLSELKRMRKILWLPVVVMLMVVLLASCMGNKTKIDTIGGAFTVIWDGGGGLSEDLFFMNHLVKAYPNTEFDFFKIMRFFPENNKEATPNNIFFIAEDDVPADLIMIESFLAPYLFNTGYLEPLDGYLAASLDVTDEIDAALLDYVREQGNGQIYGIPIGKNVYALFYNKSLFDELQMPYPVDGMTWEEVFELASLIAEHPDLGKRAALRAPDGHLLYSQFHSRFYRSG